MTKGVVVSYQLYQVVVHILSGRRSQQTEAGI
jgi:hypothetical protein